MDNQTIMEAACKVQPDREDDWTTGLRVNGDRLKEFLDAESPVLISIQTAGKHLQHARHLIKELEFGGQETTPDTIDEAIADEICESLSHFARMPAVRFFDIFVTKTMVDAAMKRIPKTYEQLPWTESQYHAMVTYCLALQALFIQGGGNNEEMLAEIVQSMEACETAKPNDATLAVMFGNFLMINGFTQDATERLEKAVLLDEDRCFGSYYTIANMCQNAVNMEKARQAGRLQQMQAKMLTERCVFNLRKYLQKAPIGHWQIHRACTSLILKNGVLKANGAERLDSIENRHPGFCAESHSLFQRGREALELYENCFGREESDFRSEHKQASSMIASMHELGLLNGKEKATSDYICANSACLKNHLKDTLRRCNRCMSVRYCSKECQTQHWKRGHKKECKILAAKLSERRMANPQKMSLPSADKSKQVGDPDTDNE